MMLPVILEALIKIVFFIILKEVNVHATYL